MNAAAIKKAAEIFDIAAELSGSDLEALLADKCAGDAELRAYVERLLAQDADGLGKFMRNPVFTPEVESGEAGDGRHPRRIGRYEIVSVIGEGGMGVVYEARQQHPHRTVAVKVV